MSTIKSVLLLLVAALPGRLTASAPDSTLGNPVENVRFEMSGSEVLIVFDLNAPMDETYHVDVILKRESDPSFEYAPTGVSGDVGSNVFSGRQRRVLWELAEEFPQGLKGEDYYFIVRASREGGEISPLVWAGAGLAVLGGTALFLVLSQGEAPSPASAVYPGPPGRP